MQKNQNENENENRRRSLFLFPCSKDIWNDNWKEVLCRTSAQQWVSFWDTLHSDTFSSFFNLLYSKFSYNLPYFLICLGRPNVLKGPYFYWFTYYSYRLLHRKQHHLTVMANDSITIIVMTLMLRNHRYWHVFLTESCFLSLLPFIA